MAVQISGNDITVPRDGTFTRNVTIGGTLTYEDVTNIDSVGLITARNGIEIGARPGVAASISVDGNMIVSGVTTLGGEVQIPDYIHHVGDNDCKFGFESGDTFAVETAGSERVRVTSDGNLGIGTITPSGLLHTHAASGTNRNYIEASAGNSFLRLKSGSTSNNSGLEFFSGSSNSANISGLGVGGLNFEVGGSERARIESAGNVNIEKNLNVVGVCTANHFSSNSGTTIQRQFKYLVSTTQLLKGGSISELNGALQISFTPKFADSNLIMEFDTSYVSPNTTNLYYCLFYDVTNSTGVSLPGASGSRVRCHWTKRSSPNDNNDNDHISMKIVTPANNTTARTYTIHFGSEGAQGQFFVSDLSSSGGSTYPMNFIITEIAA